MILPNLGTVAYYTLKSDFAKLNGFYKLNGILSYETAISTADIFENLYGAVGLTDDAAETKFNQDAVLYQTQEVLSLEQVNDPLAETPTIYYVPVSLLSLIPNLDIVEVRSSIFRCDLGMHDVSDDLEPIIGEIYDYLQATTGTTSEPIIADVDQRYMLRSEYIAMVEERNARVVRLDPKTIQIHKLQQEILRLKHQIVLRDNIILAMPPPTSVPGA